MLLTNWCIFDCLYCVNRVSSDVPRARFRVDELVALTLDFYRRNLIEGLFLSSGIVRNADYTMEQLIEVARQLRHIHGFRGYIHLKTIAEASPELISRAGALADRLSVNVELPSSPALAALAPQKDAGAIKRSMAHIRWRREDALEASTASRSVRSMPGAPARPARPPRFAPAGQSTQMIVGADASDDRSILGASVALYQSYGLKRVYYSAFSPIPHASAGLPLVAAPLLREHRLYQADWLLRFYGFSHEEIVTDQGMLSLDTDPKLAWALAHPQHFPVDLNRAAREMLLRVPGLGLRSMHKLLAARRCRSIVKADIKRLGTACDKVLAFVELADHRPALEPVAWWRQRQQRLAEVARKAAAPRQRPSAAQRSLFDPCEPCDRCDPFDPFDRLPPPEAQPAASAGSGQDTAAATPSGVLA